ncbi:YjbE family putative metal transport protein [Paenibacillus sp. LMG 31456]|uniref:YjbE family putative metal transport protein n=1 Tax=Paenibacillus foliorum TaxID=2654974 RepID=A0A972GYI8_9BACL|nr:TerC family protein [Paenibacillus foliorum]NOU96869.1 YjbE family putative metal transport protein [Paenibacillus foliorum]
MDFFTPDFWSALLAIVIIDLALAGDNAIVIGLSARNLPKEQQKKVIFWGTVGAIVIRSLLTLAVVWLLKIPGLLLIGGLLLVWIAYKLLVDEKKHDVQSAATLWIAIRTIIVADTVMGLDNVLAVAGAAHGDFILVVLGLIISVPIVVWGSTLILKWVERFPVIIYIGSAVLAWTASKMIVDEPFLKDFFIRNPVLTWLVSLILVVGVLLLGRLNNKRKVAAA